MSFSYLIEKIKKTPKDILVFKILNKIPFFSWFVSYPSVYVRFPNKNLNLIINIIRLKFWTFLGKGIPTFDYIYKNSSEKHIQFYNCNQSNIKNLMEAADLSEMIHKAKIFGCSYINDFLDIEEYSSILDEFKDENLSLSSSRVFFGKGVECINKRISKRNLKIFDEKISFLTKQFLGKSISLKEIGIQKLLTKTKDINDPNTILHIDRFLPAIKFFYFPKSVQYEQGPFGYIPFSHLINDAYINSVKKGFIDNKNKKGSAFSISNPSQFDEVAFVVKPNTFVVAFTNGIHRRIPFENELNLTRDSCRFNFYNAFTRSDLFQLKTLKNFFN